MTHRPPANFHAPIEVTKDSIHSASLYFSWSQQTIGFGQLSILLDEGKITADTEGMGKEWARRALHAAVDTLIDNAEFR